MMVQAGCRLLLFSFISFGFLLFPCSYRALAKTVEHREFTIFVDGKDAGTSKMTIVQEDNGTHFMSASLAVKFRSLLSDYTLKIEAKEWWKDDRLIGMETAAAENNKKTDVLVAFDKMNQLRMRVNAQERVISADTWTTSFWKLADARFHNKQVPVLEVDTGKEFNCELKYLGEKQLKIGNELQSCYHFRVTGGPGPIELWYDRYHRLVRQESTELGHRIIVQLINVRR
jgi:hypothetical protein